MSKKYAAFYKQRPADVMTRTSENFLCHVKTLFNSWFFPKISLRNTSRKSNMANEKINGVSEQNAVVHVLQFQNSFCSCGMVYKPIAISSCNSYRMAGNISAQ